MKSLFICHGSPTLAIEDNEYTQFLSSLGKGLQRPDAIVLFTAHWESPTLSMTYTDEPYNTIHDFGGFSKELFEVQYSASGSKKTADLLESAFTNSGIQVMKNEQRGLDHGAWVILRHMFPNADIPVVQLSVNPNESPKEHYKIGDALRALKDENILVIGSGGTVHNLRMIEWGSKKPAQWAVAFDDWVIDNIMTGQKEDLFNYEELAKFARQAVPRNEHFLPMFVAMGSCMKSPHLLHRSYDYGTLSQICIEF